jgi:LPS-assembly protein
MDYLHRSRQGRLRCLTIVLLGVGAVPMAAFAQFGTVTAPPAGGQVRTNQPVTFSADSIEYDKEHNLVIASGHVEAWQNGHVLRADKVTFDRNTGVAAATGNVTLLEPDGEVMFADYAELQNNMNDGILKDVRALLQQNGRMAANGARRTAGQINEMSKAD